MENFTNWLTGVGLSTEAALAVTFVVSLLLLAALAFVTNAVAKKGIVRVLDRFVDRSGLAFLRILQEKKVFVRLSHLAPAVVIHSLSPVLFREWPAMVEAAQIAVMAYLIGVGLLVVDAALNVFLGVYERSSSEKKIPLKGFVQAVKLIVFLLGMILIVSVLLNKSPFILVSGLGALTAILMLVFKDAILGFVAGIQLSANDMVKTGDWIEMPKQGADGDVIDVSLTTIKVQNWDQTITMIPSHLLIADSFKNWRGMVNSGGRRVKRSVYIDMRTIRFLDEELLERCMQINLLRPYLTRSLAEIQKCNSEAKLRMDDLANGRHLTNIGTFRAYCAAYIRQHPKVHQEMIQIVRQLQPTAHGLPLEIYLFTSDIGWVVHEGVQGDIFDHLLAILPHFGLRVFQQPSGSDVAELGNRLLPEGASSALEQVSTPFRGS